MRKLNARPNHRAVQDRAQSEKRNVKAGSNQRSASRGNGAGGTSPSLLQALEEAITHHQTDEVIAILDPWKDGKKSHISYSICEAARWLRCAAQWIDFDPSIFRKVSKELQVVGGHSKDRGSDPLESYLDITIARGLVAYHNNDYDSAFTNFRNSEELAKHLRNHSLQSYANYYMGRCQWRRIQYADAMPYAERAIEYGAKSKNAHAAVGPLLLKAWLLFLTKNYSGSKEIIDTLRPKLAKTDDFYNKANLLSVDGRLAQIRGDYKAAISNFEESVEEYKYLERPHPNIARSYVNMAFVCLLNGLEDEEHNRKKAGQKTPMLHKSLKLLDTAETIYNESYRRSGKPQARGLARLKAIRSYAYHYLWETTEKALKEAQEAFKEASLSDEYTVMAMAKVGESMINMRADLPRTQQPAYQAAKKAVEYSEKTENEHLQAHAYLKLGWACSDGFYKNSKEATRCCIKVEELLGETDKNYYLWKELEELKATIDLLELDSPPIVTLYAKNLEGKSLEIIMYEVAEVVCKRMLNLNKENVNDVKNLLGTGPKQVKGHADGSKLAAAWKKWNKKQPH